MLWSRSEERGHGTRPLAIASGGSLIVRRQHSRLSQPSTPAKPLPVMLVNLAWRKVVPRNVTKKAVRTMCSLTKKPGNPPGFLVCPIGRVTCFADWGSMNPACHRPGSAGGQAWSRSATGSSGLHWSPAAVDWSKYFLFHGLERSGFKREIVAEFSFDSHAAHSTGGSALLWFFRLIGRIASVVI